MVFTASVRLLFLYLLVCPPAVSQRAPVAATVAFSRNATVGAIPLSTGSTVYSGESVSTGPAGQLHLHVGETQLALAPSSAARIFRAGERVVVQLQAGSLAYSAQALTEPLTIYAGDIKFAPALSQAAGRIRLVSLCEILASVSQGALQVTGAAGSRVVQTGQNYLASTEFGVTYEPPAKGTSGDLPPDWSDPQFHRDHKHVACDAPRTKIEKVGSLEKIAIAGEAAGATVVIIQKTQSPMSPDSP